MKKQILILAFFVLAMMAGSLSSFGQMGASVAEPQTGTCVSEPLHPRAGVPYTYEVGNPNGTATAAGYTWWTTQNPNFINTTTFAPDQTGMLTVAPGGLVATGANYGTVNGAGNSMSITWSPEILALTEYQGEAADLPKKPTFVVVQATGTCNNNLEVYEINPLPSFTVDIANIDPATLAIKDDWTDQAVDQCVDQVRGANYITATHDVLMDYGTNTLYFEVIAANFVTNYTPTFEVTGGLTGTQTATIGWAYTLAAAQANTFIDGAQPLAIGTPVTGATPLTTSLANTVLGAAIYVKVVIDNNTEESIALSNFVLTVDGEDSTGQWDIVNSDCTVTAGPDGLDIATHTINPRPDVSDGTVDGQPNPDTFIPKQ